MRVAVPKRGEVHSAFKTLLKRLSGSVKRINEHAASRMRRGDYTGAEAWVQLGTALGEFRSRTLDLQGEWKGLCRDAGGKRHRQTRKKRGPTTPLWEYYQPILRAIVQAGGEARRSDIEPVVFKVMEARLQPGDVELSGGRRPRWQNSIPRARKQLIREGWLSSGGSKGLWRVTEKGRIAAARQRSPASGKAGREGMEP